MQIGDYADPWYFTDVLRRLIEIIDGIRSQQDNNKFSYTQHTLRLLAIFAAVLYCRNFKLESGICTFSKRLSSLQWVVLNEYSLIFVVCHTSSFQWHRQKFTFGMILPSLGELTALKMYAYAMGSRLLGLIWTGLWRHRNITKFLPKFLNFSACY